MGSTSWATRRNRRRPGKRSRRSKQKRRQKTRGRGTLPSFRQRWSHSLNFPGVFLCHRNHIWFSFCLFLQEAPKDTPESNKSQDNNHEVIALAKSLKVVYNTLNAVNIYAYIYIYVPYDLFYFIFLKISLLCFSFIMNSSWYAPDWCAFWPC